VARRQVAYAAIYVDRGDKLATGRNAVKTQLSGIREMVARQGDEIAAVGVDVIVGKRDADKLETLVTEAERLAHEAFADATGDRTFVVVGLIAETRDHDPRTNNPHAAMSVIVAGMPEDVDGEIVPTEHGYEIRPRESDA
jgi:hypothetical protein